jgi:hypothetical protein
MKLWIASYPRSGNTFVRLILNQAFGIKSTSVYPSESEAMKERPWLIERIGFTDEAERPNQWLAIKTHDKPFDDGPAIYIVRDGRAAVVSYRHMLRDFTAERPDLADIIRGKIWPCSWSEHYAAWSPETRPETLLLRYEELKDVPHRACDKIAAFLGVAQIAPFAQNFDELHEFEPTLFRVASNESNIAEMQGEIELFDELHAPLMERLGYYN